MVVKDSRISVYLGDQVKVKEWLDYSLCIPTWEMEIWLQTALQYPRQMSGKHLEGEKESKEEKKELKKVKRVKKRFCFLTSGQIAIGAIYEGWWWFSITGEIFHQDSFFHLIYMFIVQTKISSREILWPMFCRRSDHRVLPVHSCLKIYEYIIYRLDIWIMGCILCNLMWG